LGGDFFENLDDFTEVSAANGIHNDVLALFDVREVRGVEVVDFAYFCKSNTDNFGFHGDNYTVAEGMGIG
jgi:hypothetical protein